MMSGCAGWARIERRFCLAHVLWYTYGVSSKPREQLIAEWAQRLKRRGLSETACMLLPVLKPLGLLASQMVWMGQPLLRGLADETLVQELAVLLEDPEALAGLEQRLELDDTPPA